MVLKAPTVKQINRREFLRKKLNFFGYFIAANASIYIIGGVTNKFGTQYVAGAKCPSYTGTPASCLPGKDLICCRGEDYWKCAATGYVCP